MLRPKNEPLFRPQHRKYQELTPKIPAKTPMNYRQRKLAGQSSALPANRSRPKDMNFNLQRPTHRLNSIQKEKSALTEEQIKNSRVYRLLLEEMSSLQKREEQTIQKMQEVTFNENKIEVKRSKENQLSDIKSEQHAIKLQIWELRNETMELKDSIKEEKEETERLMDELGITEEDLENQLEEHFEEDGENEGENYEEDGGEGNNNVNNNNDNNEGHEEQGE